MEYLIGVVLALAVGVFTTFLGMDRDRALYPTALIVIAVLYALFAVIGGSRQALIMESVAAVLFIALAVAGFKRSLWLAVIGLVGHGVFDLFHGLFIENPGVPVWWPMFCFAYDVTAGAFLAWLLWSNRVRVAPA
ncbi:MAG: hypothetical protein AB7V18_00130 [Pyrinomonadaceae bacterium]